jgi:hypothetical protein
MGTFEVMFVPPNLGLQVSDIPGPATHEGGEIVPASVENTRAHLEALTIFLASLHGDFEVLRPASDMK